MSNQFSGKKLLVVGGTSGMGKETARLVLAQGGNVVIVGNRPEKTEEARKELAALGQVSALTANLTKDEDVAALLKAIDEQHPDIDLLVNAAGVFFPKPFLEHSDADYDQYMKLNKAFFFITQKVAGNLAAKGKPGAIVNIGSMWAKQAIAATPSSAYSMAKARPALPDPAPGDGAGSQAHPRQRRVASGGRNPDLRGLHSESRSAWRDARFQQLPSHWPRRHPAGCRRGCGLPALRQGGLGDWRDLGRGRRRHGWPQLRHDG